MKIIYFSFLLLIFNACNLVTNTVPAKGPIKKVDKTITDFSSIALSSGLDLEITMGTTESVSVEANDDILKYIIVEKKGSSLVMKKEDGINFERSAKVKIYVTAKQLDALSCSGSSSITCTNTIQADKMDIAISGGGNIDATLSCKTLATALSGGSNLKLKGIVADYSLAASGSSEIEGYDMVVTNFTGEMSGSSTANITINGNITVAASGGSTIRYRGAGVISAKSLSGGSEIIKE
jgi:Putative auto-transporter adhesin, head GIN domain